MTAPDKPKPTDAPDKVWHIPEPVFGRLFSLFVCPADTYVRRMNRYCGPDGIKTPAKDVEAQVNHLVHEDGTPWIAIWVRANDLEFPARVRRGEPGVIATIAHECLHAVIDSFDDVGMRITTADPEPACYYLGWLLQNVLTRIGSIGETKAPAGGPKRRRRETKAGGADTPAQT